MRFCFFILLLFLPGYFIAFGQVSADFSASSTSGCTPFTVQFKDLSSGNPTQWYWDFGNGTNSYIQNPSAVYTLKGTYTVKLIVKNAKSQDVAEKINYITVSATPDDSFSINKTSGCIPLQVSFTNNTNLFGETIKSWLWNFGDGQTSNLQSPSHTYNARGVFDVSLVVKNNGGCVDSFAISSAVKAGNKPKNVAFKASPLDGCALDLRNFTDQSTGNINTWRWNFGDGGTSSVQNPSYHYTDTGFFTVKLVAGDNGCEDSVSKPLYMHIKGPIAKINRTIDCADPYTVTFSSASKDAQGWSWDFGDGGTSVSKSQVHTYSATGLYPVKLTVSGNGCTDTTSYPMYIVKQKVSYNITPAQNSFCKNDTIQFDATNYNPADVQYFTWSFDNGATQTSFYLNLSSVKNSYPRPGSYPAPILYVVDKELCKDTIQKQPLVITGVSADFKHSAPACTNTAVNFSDNSTPYSNTPVTKWIWQYGDGDSAVAFSSPVNYVYPFAGDYTVLLQVQDADGCTDTISHQVTIADTPVIDAGKDTFICEGKSIVLQPTGGANYIWSSSPYLSCTNCTNPVAAPADTTVFYVTGKNAAGCSSKDSLIVNVPQQETITVQPLADTICAGESVQLLASGADTYTWQPATGLSNANIANPVASPAANTVYTVTGMDKAGCFSNTASVSITAGTKPVISVADSSVAILAGTPYQVNTTNSPDVIKWQWQPPQGLSDATIANPVARPQQTTNYTVTAENSSGCISTAHITITVLCNNSILFVPNTFSPNNDGMNDYFYPRSSADVNVKSFRIFNRWGQEIFEKTNFLTNDPASGWNGTFKGNMQQPDAYIYVLQVQCENGTVLNSKGSISLIR